jgi:hypothetical protein
MKYRIRYIHCRRTDGPMDIGNATYRIGQIYVRRAGRDRLYDSEAAALQEVERWDGHDYWIPFVEEM